MGRGNKLRRTLAGVLAASIMISGLSLSAFAQTMDGEAAKSFPDSSFAREFANPDGSAKPYIRWWVAPGLMNEEETKAEVRKMAEAGYGGIELVAIMSMAPFGSEAWNSVMKWALEEADTCGITLDFTIGQGWPVKTPAITQVDDARAEQALFYSEVSFTANADGSGMVYTRDELPLPEGGQFESDRPCELVAVTAARRQEGQAGVYETDSAVDITECVKGISKDRGDVTGAGISWEAPDEGEWSIFYLYRQGMGDAGKTDPVVDHFSAEATQAVLDYWDNTLMADQELRDLYEKNGGSIFCDSLELGNKNKSNAAFWTPELLEEFKERRGYDLTPYLPTLFIDNYYSYYAHGQDTDAQPNFEFGDEGYQIREDFYKTLTELFTENHVEKIRDWAHGHNMTLRYQVYGASMELTQPTLAADIVETESWGHTDIMDMYRMQSGAVHLNGSGLYSTESAAVISLAWAQTWTGSQREGNGNGDTYWRDDGGNYVYTDKGNEDAGFLYHYNRQMAAGVNRAVLHGFSYKSALMQQWPGDSFMSMGNFPNEWDDKTPMWEHIQDMTGYLSRAQYVMQKGQADVDLAVYRLYYYNYHTSMDWELNEIEKAGYTYDYAAPDLIRQEQMKVGSQGGRSVLSEEGPSYKALILDQRKLMNGEEQMTASDMPLDVAEKIVDYARQGLPVVIVGEAPSSVDTFAGSSANKKEEDKRLNDLMRELKEMKNTVLAGSQEEVPAALAALGVEPDVKRDAPSALLNFHRTEDNSDYYYLYNSDMNRELSQTVMLSSEGTPYLLNPWCGEITRLGKYENRDGRTCVDITLRPNEAMFLAVCDEENPSPHVVSADITDLGYDDTGALCARLTTAGEQTFSLGNGKKAVAAAKSVPEQRTLDDWSMTLESWSQGTLALETAKEEKGPYTLKKLVSWNEIQGLEDAAGKAVYTTSFDMNGGWEEHLGAYLEFDYVSDTMHVWVNGKEIPGVNQMSKKVDMGEYLKPGTNELRVEVVSNLANIKSSYTQRFGIVGEVRLTPYRQVPLQEVSNPVPPKPQPVLVSGITLNKPQVRLFAGETLALTAAVTPASAQNKKLSWYSSDSEVVSVDAAGRLRAGKAGKAVVTASAQDGSGKAAKCSIKVVIPTVKLNAGNARLQVGKSTTAVKASDLQQGDKIKTWKSSNKKVATVNRRGKITAKRAGTVKITVTTQKGAKATLKLKVTKKKVVTRKLRRKAGSLTLRRGKTTLLRVERDPITATEKLTYTSTNKRVVTVDRKGRVKARRKGKAVIRIKASNGVRTRIRVTVR